MFFFSVVLIRTFHVMPDKLGFSRIITECVNVVSFVPTRTFAEPDGSLVVRKHAVPFVIVDILIECRLNIHSIILQRKNELHSGIYQSGNIFLGVKTLIGNNDTITASCRIYRIHECRFINDRTLHDTIKHRLV